MSASMHVYVGPYLKCFPREVNAELDLSCGDRLHDLQGESSLNVGCQIIGPNVKVFGIARTLTWHRTGESDEVAELSNATSIDNEIAAFAAQFEDDIAMLRGLFDRVELAWGVVPGWF